MSAVYSRGKKNYLGSLHGGALNSVRGGFEKDLLNYFISFVVSMDPNDRLISNLNPDLIIWPKWNSTAQTMLELVQDVDKLHLIKDEFRSESIELLTNLLTKYPFSSYL